MARSRWSSLVRFRSRSGGAGASRLSIVGHTILNRGFVSAGMAQRFGFVLRIINGSTLELTKALE
jgi:hypothetical protein